MADVPAQLSWSSFPFCQLATATGRGPTSHPYAVLDVNFRHYGRTVHEYMLLGWGPLGAPHVREVLQMLMREESHKLKSVNFTLLVPPGLPTRTGPTEWRIPGDWADPRLGTGKTAQTVRRACRGLDISFAQRSTYDKAEAETVFHIWLAWAKTRHFMVFRGVYERWLQLWFEGGVPLAHAWLFVIRRDERAVGIFGGEVDPTTREAVVTLAKHTPELDAKALWVLGLTSMMAAYSPSMVHCGADADELKRGLGFIPHRSWVPDLRALS